MTYIDILNNISKTSSTKKKEEVLLCNKDIPFLKDFLQYMIDIRIKFNIASFNVIFSTEEVTITDDEAWLMFYELVNKFINRELTGNAAMEAIDNLFSQFNAAQSYWLGNCLAKDSSHLNMGRKIVNKVWPGLVLDFKVSGAEDESNLDKFNFGDKAILDLKLNGIRSPIVIRNGVTEDIYGRSGLPIKNFRFLFEHIEPLVEGKSCVLDGEVHVNNVLEDAMSLFGFDFDKTEDDFRLKSGKVGSGWKKYCERKAEIQKFRDEAVFCIFDYLEIDEWDNQKCTTKHSDRFNKIVNLLENNESNKVEIVESTVVYSIEEAQELANRYIDQGLEGGVLKEYDHFYSFKRDRNWVKIKEEDHITVKIIGSIKSKQKYNSDGSEKPEMMGAFVVSCVHPSSNNDISFEVGTGKLFSEDFRINAWENQDEYIGKFMDISLQRFTDISAICPRAENMRLDLEGVYNGT